MSIKNESLTSVLDARPFELSDEQKAPLFRDNLIEETNYDSEEFIESEEASSLGNIDDNDQYHEIVYINNGNLIVENDNGSSVNGFPVSGDYLSVPLIFNIHDESSGTEIICINGRT